MKVELWTLVGGASVALASWIIKRIISWYLPPGHHSKRVERYGVRDINPEEEEDTA